MSLACVKVRRPRKHSDCIEHTECLDLDFSIMLNNVRNQDILEKWLVLTWTQEKAGDSLTYLAVTGTKCLSIWTLKDKYEGIIQYEGISSDPCGYATFEEFVRILTQWRCHTHSDFHSNCTVEEGRGNVEYRMKKTDHYYFNSGIEDKHQQW